MIFHNFFRSAGKSCTYFSLLPDSVLRYFLLENQFKSIVGLKIARKVVECDSNLNLLPDSATFLEIFVPNVDLSQFPVLNCFISQCGSD